MRNLSTLHRLHSARDEHRALAAVNIYDAIGARAVAAAAEAENRPIIIQTGPSAFELTGRTSLTAIAIAARDQSPAQVGVHLDHSRSLDEVRACLDAGYDSVMFDGSHLSLRENITLTTKAAQIAHGYGAWIEGEIGATPGEEDRSTDTVPGALTDPAEAQTFVEATDVDAVAVSVGNVHGMSSGPAKLAFDRLAEIRATVQVPLALHGASGLSADQVRSAIDLGVAKVNVNTEIRRAYLTALHSSLADGSDDLIRHLTRARNAATTAIRHKIGDFDNSTLEVHP